MHLAKKAKFHTKDAKMLYEMYLRKVWVRVGKGKVRRNDWRVFAKGNAIGKMGAVCRHHLLIEADSALEARRIAREIGMRTGAAILTPYLRKEI